MTKEKLKTVDIKGKQYIEVSERVRYFNEAYPKGYINTEIISHENGLILMKAIVIPDIECPERKFTGYAQEEKGKGLVNTLSYIENCETSAVGRALGFLGIGVETSIRSADEMRNVKPNGKPPIKPPEAIEEHKPEAPQALSEPQIKKEQPEATIESSKEETGLKTNPEEKKPLSYTERFVVVKKSLGSEDYFFALKKAGYENAGKIPKDKVEGVLKDLEFLTAVEETFEDTAL